MTPSFGDIPPKHPRQNAAGLSPAFISALTGGILCGGGIKVQTELFEVSTPIPAIGTGARHGPHALEKTFLTLRLDQTIGVVLVLMVFFVLSFSWGVEKGKHSVRNDLVIRAVTPESEASALPKDLTLVEDTPSLAARIEAAPAATVSLEVPLPVKEAPRASGSSKTSPAGKYTIQHIIYKTKSAADREIQKLTKKGQPAFIIPSGKYLQVCIAGFQTKKEADRYLRQLRSQRIISGDSYVRPIPA